MREGLLRPEFQDWYPGLTPGQWYDATTLVELVLEQQRTKEPKWALVGRVLSDAHFEFRGGKSSPRASRRSRRDDTMEPA